MNYHKKPSPEDAHKHNKHIHVDISIYMYLYMKRIRLNITNTYKSLARIASHLFLKLANVPFLVCYIIYLNFYFSKKNIKIREDASFCAFPNVCSFPRIIR